MQKDILRLKKIYLLIQFSILLLIVSIYTIIAAINYSWEYKEIVKTNINNTAILLANNIQSNNSNTFIQDNKENFLAYIIDAKNKTLKRKHKLKNTEKTKIWESYREKIIYEIATMKRGWIEYPYHKIWDMSRNTYIIRYIPIQNSDDIIAIETTLESPLKIFLNMMPTKAFIQAIIIILLGFFLIASSTEKNIVIMERILRENIKNKENIVPFSENDKNILIDKESDNIADKSTMPNELKDDNFLINNDTYDFHKIETDTDMPKKTGEKITSKFSKIFSKKDISDTSIKRANMEHKNNDDICNKMPISQQNLEITDDMIVKIKGKIAENEKPKKLEKKEVIDSNNLGENDNILQPPENKDPSTIIGQAFSIEATAGSKENQEIAKDPTNDSQNKPIDNIRINIPKEISPQLSKMLKEMHNKNK